ncbi:MAG: LPS export ABC transporter periplasmic protein LptC [Calditrichia bacterium]
MKRFWLITILLLLAGAFSCSSPQEEPGAANTERKNLPDQESWNSTVVITRESRLVAEIKAGYIATYNKKQETVLGDSIHVDFYNREGVHNSVLTADSGIVYNKSNNLLATGHVVVVSDSGIVLKTEILRWDNKRQKIISDVPVVFATETDTLMGETFISDPDLKNYEIRNARGYSKRIIPLEK